MLTRLASQSARIASTGSPAPRKMPLIRNSSVTVTQPPSMIAVKVRPFAATSGEAPSIARRSDAKVTPATPSANDTAHPQAIACTAAADARSGFPSPMRRATIAAAPMLSPIETANTRASSESDRPRMATASDPRRPTKYTSTTENTDCIPISRTIGTASSSTARPRRPRV